jgi:hypothetical protein
VLALAQGSVRVVEVTPDLDPAPFNVDDLPSDVASAAGKSSIADQHRVAASRAQKDRRSVCASTPDRSTGRSGRF